jgi:formate-dependent nitrite reductase membrane component NrfD
MEFVRPMKQGVWKWPAAANFFLGGLATGYYLLSLLAVIVLAGVGGASERSVFKLLAPALAGLGFWVLTLEAGRPWRSRFLLRHLGRSWMSRETLAGIIFIIAAIFDWYVSHPLLWGLAAAAALGLLISQGYLIYRARAVTAWNVPLMPVIFLTSGFATGVGLILFISPALLTITGSLLVVGLVWIGLDLGVWILYLFASREPAFQAATATLRRPVWMGCVVGIGRLVPLVLLVISFIPGFEPHQSLAILAGLTLIIGGLAQKAGIILGAGYLRAIVLGSTTTPMPGQENSVSSALSSAGLVRSSRLVSHKN